MYNFYKISKESFLKYSENNTSNTNEPGNSSQASNPPDPNNSNLTLTPIEDDTEDDKKEKTEKKKTEQQPSTSQNPKSQSSSNELNYPVQIAQIILGTIRNMAGQDADRIQSVIISEIKELITKQLNESQSIKEIKLSKELMNIIKEQINIFSESGIDASSNNIIREQFRNLVNQITYLTNLAVIVVTQSTATQDDNFRAFPIHIYIWNVYQGAVCNSYLKHSLRSSIPPRFYQLMQDGVFYERFKYYLYNMLDMGVETGDTGNTIRNIRNKAESTLEDIGNRFTKRTRGLLHQRHINNLDRYLSGMGMTRRELLEYLNHLDEAVSSNMVREREAIILNDLLRNHGIINYRQINNERIRDLYQANYLGINLIIPEIVITYSLSPVNGLVIYEDINFTYTIGNSNITGRENLDQLFTIVSNEFNNNPSLNTENAILLRASGRTIDVTNVPLYSNVYIVTDVSLAVLKNILEHLIPNRVNNNDNDIDNIINQINTNTNSNTNDPILTKDHINLSSIYSLELAMIIDSCQNIAPLSHAMRKNISTHLRTGIEKAENRTRYNMRGIRYELSVPHTLWPDLIRYRANDFSDAQEDGIFRRVFDYGRQRYRQTY